MAEKYIRQRLFEMQDLQYREFHSKLMPTVLKDLIIGVRTPELRKFAKEISKTAYAEDFIKILCISIMKKTIFMHFLLNQ